MVSFVLVYRVADPGDPILIGEPGENAAVVFLDSFPGAGVGVDLVEIVELLVVVIVLGNSGICSVGKCVVHAGEGRLLHAG
ncbi:hypothetical protein [Pelagicoccus sp. SDUM812002]|uniref:hypothetical protein n=1 Tax=Pelagicoccus sp. SDUM812002 TaxID=3041266 RepID=UPI00280FA176|nr:hypothetical protein [Pelagicoccus sp. SDUM812002]MDQ8185659.1 hypothetical protein [Pelagicoccus sp. SDUM812002]